VKIALAQINPTVGDFQGNTKKIIEFAGEASAAQADVVMFPELAVCGYPPAEFLDNPTVLARAG
jgi:NAD+ synthase (glutamine-hydrolysing)